MKNKKQTEKRKIHVEQKWTLMLMGMLCLFLTGWLLSFSITDASGATSLDYYGSTSGNFWYGKGIPAKSDFWMNLTVTAKVNTESDTIEKNSLSYDAAYTGSTQLHSEDFENLNVMETSGSTFSLDSITAAAKAQSQSFVDNNSRVVGGTGIVNMSNWRYKNSTDPVNLWHDSADSTRAYHSLNYVPRETKTYYRIITDASETETDLGTELIYFYKHYDMIAWSDGKDMGTINNAQCFENSIVFNGDRSGEIWGIVDSFVKEWGLEEYRQGDKIPLKDSEGNTVLRVEMITLRRMDYYGTSYVYTEEGDAWTSSGYNHLDVDFLLHTSHNYNFSYTKKTPLESPSAKTENGETGNILTMSLEEAVFLTDHENNPSGTALQYYLSSEQLEDGAISESAWSTYNEQTPPFVEGQKYLYIRTIPDTEDNRALYSNSLMKCIEIKYRETSTARVKTEPAGGGTLDVNQIIKMWVDESQAEQELCTILYSASEAAPVFKKVPYEDRIELNLDAQEQAGVLLELGSQKYIKLNGLWYECLDKNIEVYSEDNQPTVGEELRTDGYKMFYVQVVEEGKELGYYQQLRYIYGLSEQTASPNITPETDTDNPAEVTMLDELKLTAEAGTTIIYTLNGSMPSYSMENGELITGSGTYVYESPIIVSESFANYGKNFTVMAQAMTYNEAGFPTKSDSEVVRFTYKVLAKNALASVTSVPVTSADNPTEVQVGETIKLYSETEGVLIFYTLDGSEPHFDSTTGEILSDSTILYKGTNGVEVKEPDGRSQIVITAVACKLGMATSDITRIIYQYPDAVAMPYATPGSGKVTEGTEVTLKTSTENAIIYYEIAYGKEKAKDPTETSQVFDEENPIKISKNANIKAIAMLKGLSSGISTFSYEVSDKLSDPVSSVETGAMVPAGTVINLTADKDAVIRYTLDGSDPKDSKNKSVLVGSSVILSGKAGDVVVLRAYASKEGFSDSEIVNYSYSISSYDGGIYADVESGSVVKNGDEIILNTDMTDAEIYYTTDGTTPTEDSYHGRRVIIHGEPGENFTIMAMAVVPGTEKSNSYAIFTYTIENKLSAPTSSVPTGAIFTKPSAITLTSESGRIYYTTDGTDPTTSSSLYKNRIEIQSAVIIKAIAVADDYEQSDISVFEYGFAEQVAAPIASYASGELEMGTKVTFTSATEGATIYYRTDGKDINLSRKNELEIYKEPITINQATNFKVIAVKDKMQDSNVLKVGYTVKEPVVIEAVDEEEALRVDNQSNRLQSRRSFSDTESGPSYKDVVLRNASYGAIVAAEEGSLPDQVQLVVEAANVTEAVNRRVKQVISDSFGVVASYDVTLLVNGEETQPEGTIEIGLPIPVEYENAMIHIVHVAEDGNIELFETRRSGGVAYAKVDHLSVFSITAPVEFAEEASTFPWLPVMYTLAVGLTGIGIWLIYKAKKQRREEGMQDV